MHVLGLRTSLLCQALAVAGLAIHAANAQTLRRRGGIVTPELQKIYASPGYDLAYQSAETTYNESRPKPFVPYLWDSKKPLSWIGFKQSEFGKYTIDFGELKDQLDAASENVQVRRSPEKVAQLSELQDRLTEENLNALNAMVTSVDLGALFSSNHRQEIADLWVPWQR